MSVRISLVEPPLPWKVRCGPRRKAIREPSGEYTGSAALRVRRELRPVARSIVTASATGPPVARETASDAPSGEKEDGKSEALVGSLVTAPVSRWTSQLEKRTRGRLAFPKR